MDFKKTTDELFSPVTHEDLAVALGVSVAAIRQARLAQGAKAHRSPPAGWEQAVAKVANAKAKRLAKLVDKLR